MFLGCRGCNVSWCSVCSVYCAFCLSCDACSARCCLMGSMLVSPCRCCALMFREHLVATRSAVFFTVCTLFVFVSDEIGDQIVPPYSNIVLVIAVYVLSSVFLEFPHCVGQVSPSSFSPRCSVTTSIGLLFVSHGLSSQNWRG